MGSSKTIAVWLNSKLVIGVTLNILIFTEIATSTTKGLEAVLKSETRRHEAVPNIKHFSSTGSLSKSQLEGDTKDNSSSTSGQTNDLSGEKKLIAFLLKLDVFLLIAWLPLFAQICNFKLHI